MNTINLKQALQFLKEYYLTAKMYNCAVMGGLDSLNKVIVKLQNDLESVAKLKENVNENQA